MTNEEAKVFLDNLKICINEHPVVADWLVEIADRKTEPTSSKMEQVDEPKTQMKTQNSNSTFEKADEPQREEHCETCKHKDECEGATYEYKNTEWWCLAYVPIDEPQTELVRVKYHCINCAENGSYKCSKCDGEMYYKYDKDEPQTELVNDSPILVKDLVDDEFNPYDEECMRCKHLKLKCEFVPSYCKYEPKDEPQTERSK